jgi:hypothetical protein
LVSATSAICGAAAYQIGLFSPIGRLGQRISTLVPPLRSPLRASSKTAPLLGGRQFVASEAKCSRYCDKPCWIACAKGRKPGLKLRKF